MNRKEKENREFRMLQYQLAKDYVAEMAKLQKEFGGHETQLSEAVADLGVTYFNARGC